MRTAVRGRLPEGGPPEIPGLGWPSFPPLPRFYSTLLSTTFFCPPNSVAAEWPVAGVSLRSSLLCQRWLLLRPFAPDSAAAERALGLVQDLRRAPVHRAPPRQARGRGRGVPRPADARRGPALLPHHGTVRPLSDGKAAHNKSNCLSFDARGGFKRPSLTRCSTWPCAASSHHGASPLGEGTN